MVFSTSATVFAMEDTTTIREANETADSIEKIITNDNVSTDLKLNDNHFSSRKNDATFMLPQNGNKEIKFNVNNESNILMSLPNKDRYMNGVLAKDGTVVYDSLLNNYSVAVQSIENERDGIIFDELRTSVVLKNKNVPSEYSFEYDLPQGYSMMSVEKYLTTYASNEEKEYLSNIQNAIFILDENNQIVYTIDGLEAVDSEGRTVASQFKVDENKITQSVEFDENTNFPIVVYNASHPDKSKTVYLDEEGILKVRNRYSGSSLAVLIDGALGYGIGKIYPPAGSIYTFITVTIGAYELYTYQTWDTFYLKVSKSKVYNYLRVITRYHYHPGKRTYYPASASYAYAKDTPK